MASLIGFPLFDGISFILARLSVQVVLVPTALPALSDWYFRREQTEKLVEVAFPMQQKV